MRIDSIRRKDSMGMLAGRPAELALAALALLALS
jgi:hypothetical protein